MSSLDDELRAGLAAWEAAGLRRELAPLERAADFVSNDYLGLAGDPEIVEAARAAAAEHGAGGRASRLLGGGSPADRAAERAVADWLGAQDALLFPSGYQANVGLVPALVGPGDLVLSDALNHASLIDGARLSRARIAVFDHGDVGHLDALLAARSDAGRTLVLTEGIFSMDGDAAPLAAIAERCAERGAHLVVDEAHAAGVVGPEGAGSWAVAVAAGAPQGALAARVVTGGKALGVAGALVVGSHTLREHVLARARSFVFSTAVAPAVAGALAAAVPRVRGAQGQRARDRARGLAQGLAAALELPEPAGAIVPVPVGDDRRAVACAEALRARDLELRAIRPPTVPPGSARLRVVLHATNTDEQVERLIEGLRDHDLPARISPPSRIPPPSLSTGHVLVVVGTDTAVGKTVVAAALLRAAAGRGRARYWKPVQTGLEDDTEEVRRLAAGSGATCAEPVHRFALPASPHEAAAQEGATVSVEQIDAALAEHGSVARSASGTLVVELAGGLLVPWTGGFLQADWLARHRLPCVLVARSGLGTLNHTLLTVEALAARGLRPRALVLVGPPHASNRQTLARRTGVAVLEFPPLDRLAPETLDAWLAGVDLAPVLDP